MGIKKALAVLGNFEQFSSNGLTDLVQLRCIFNALAEPEGWRHTHECLHSGKDYCICGQSDQPIDANEKGDANKYYTIEDADKDMLREAAIINDPILEVYEKYKNPLNLIDTKACVEMWKAIKSYAESKK